MMISSAMMSTGFKSAGGSNLVQQTPANLRPALGKASLLLTALIALLPYICTVKLPPSPSFWAEMVAVVLTCAWLASMPRRDGKIAESAIPVAVVGCGAFGAALILQLLLKLPLFIGGSILSLAGLLLAALVCLAGARIRAAGETVRVLDIMARAFLAALTLNALSVYAERHGIHVYGYQLGLREVPVRAEGLIGQPNQLAAFAAICCAAAHYLWMRGKLPTLAHLLVTLVSACIIATTGSRAGLIAAGVGFALAALALRGHPRRFLGWGLLTAALVFAVVAQVALPIPDAAGTGSLAISRGESRGRLELWHDSWELIKLHPLSGVGYGNFMGARWNELTGPLLEPNASQAHNIILQLASELGVPAALCILLPIGIALWHCLKVGLRSGVEPAQFLVASIALMIGVYAMVEYPLWYTFFLIPFALALGLIEQPDLRVKASTLPSYLRWAGWTVAAAFCTLVACDYYRSESLYTKLDFDLRTNGGAPVMIAMDEASKNNVLSFFDVYANLMFARALHADGFMMGYKLAINERAMLTLTNHETIGRQIAFLASSGREAEAKALLAKTRRGVDLEEKTRGVLKSLAGPEGTPLAKFVSGLPPLPASAGAR